MRIEVKGMGLMSNMFLPERYDTSDFTIRMYQPSDAALLNEAVNSSHEHLKTFMSWSKPYHAMEESQSLVRRFCAQYLLAENFTMGIFSPDGSRVLGGTGYHFRLWTFDSGTAEIGMWIRADAAGKGLGTACLRALLRWGFTAWPFERIIWTCDDRNTASARTAEKAGMRREAHFLGDVPLEDGTRRNTYLYAKLRREWQAEHPDSID